MTIHIFGDSYAAHEKKRYYMKDHERWYQMLENFNKEIVHNYAESGAGPYHSFDKFYDLYENYKIKKKDKIIFVLSSPYRFPLATMKESMRFTRMADLHEIITGYKNDDTKKELEPFSYDAMVVFETFRKELDYINLKNICFLKTLSEMNDWKTIVFRVFGMNPNINNKNYPENLYDFSSMNSRNFKYYSQPLQNIADNEYIDKNHVFSHAINHLLERNHKILYNIISNFFYKTNFTEKFHEKFVKDVVGKDIFYENKNNFVDFIYE